MSPHKCFVCDTYFTPTRTLSVSLTLPEISSLYYFITFHALSPSADQTLVANLLQHAAIFPRPSALVSDLLCYSYMFLLIHNRNVRNIQVCDCADPPCEIGTELCASLAHYLLFSSRGRCPAEVCDSHCAVSML